MHFNTEQGLIPILSLYECYNIACSVLMRRWFNFKIMQFLLFSQPSLIYMLVCKITETPFSLINQHLSETVLLQPSWREDLLQDCCIRHYFYLSAPNKPVTECVSWVNTDTENIVMLLPVCGTGSQTTYSAFHHSIPATVINTLVTQLQTKAYFAWHWLSLRLCVVKLRWCSDIASVLFSPGEQFGVNFLHFPNMSKQKVQ